MSKDKSVAVWSASPAGSAHAKHLRPGTKEFFDTTMQARNEIEVPWLFDLVPFSSYRDRKVLELGCGAGYDALEFCRHNADYTGIDITPQNIERTRQHLSYYGYTPRVIEGDTQHLLFPDESFDVVFSNGVLHHVPDMDSSLQEGYRVLKRGGEFWMIVYHRDSIYYWVTLFLVDHLLRFGFLKRTFRERLSMVEYTTSSERPLVNVYSRGDVKRKLQRAGFTAHSIRVRKLLKEDLPAVPLVQRLWRLIPQTLLDYLGQVVGWYVIVLAVKE